jgi:hypothetical protein
MLRQTVWPNLYDVLRRGVQGDVRSELPSEQLTDRGISVRDPELPRLRAQPHQVDGRPTDRLPSSHFADF